MKTVILFAATLTAFLFAGCSAKIADDFEREYFRCLDVRDGAEFSFWNDTASDIVYNPLNGHWSYNITTDSGEKVLITKTVYESHLKCTKTKGA
ncbi:hypothetical protein [Litorivivens sp.]|uniref:hypothetical protein n=1 Tax=Litorivivens sp. TaxID=2020868 RepID=UPI0035646CA9